MDQLKMFPERQTKITRGLKSMTYEKKIEVV